jgi:hypothetical protein
MGFVAFVTSLVMTSLISWLCDQFLKIQFFIMTSDQFEKGGDQK